MGPLGLGDEQDITLKGLKALKGCAKIYLEAYTSVLTVPKEQLEEAKGLIPAALEAYLPAMVNAHSE